MQTSHALRVAATAGLPSVTTSPRSEAPQLAVGDVRIATVHRVQGLVWHALDTGFVLADEGLTELAGDAQLAALRTCLVAEETGLLALDALAAVAIEARALKGIAMAHLDYPDPAQRVFGDADVLIRPADLGIALDVLGSAGFERVQPPVRGWWERRFGKAVVLQAPNGGELDLHIRVAAGFFGERIGHDALFARRERHDVAGRQVSALAPEGRLLQACAHAVVGGGSGLRALRDVAQLILVTGVDWSSVVNSAVAGGYDGIVSEAICATWCELALDPCLPPMVWASNHSAPDDQRAAIRASQVGGVGWSAEGWGAISSYAPFDQVRFVAGLAWPTTESLRARGRSRPQHLRRVVRRRHDDER